MPVVARCLPRCGPPGVGHKLASPVVLREDRHYRSGAGLPIRGMRFRGQENPRSVMRTDCPARTRQPFVAIRDRDRNSPPGDKLAMSPVFPTSARFDGTPRHPETPGHPSLPGDIRDYSLTATTFVVHALSLVMVPLNAVEKKARVSAASLERPPATARARVIASQLLVQFLVAVDDPAAPLDVGFAQGSLDASWTLPRKEISSSMKLGRMAHLLWQRSNRESEGIGAVRTIPEIDNVKSAKVRGMGSSPGYRSVQ